MTIGSLIITRLRDIANEQSCKMKLESGSNGDVLDMVRKKEESMRRGAF